MSDNSEPELTPEQEALVGQFVHQLDGAGQVVTLVNTPVGPVRITDEDNARIRAAAVEKTIQLIRKDPPTLPAKIIRDVSGICLATLILAGTAYAVHAAVRAIFGG